MRVRTAFRWDTQMWKYSITSRKGPYLEARLNSKFDLPVLPLPCEPLMRTCVLAAIALGLALLATAGIRAQNSPAPPASDRPVSPSVEVAPSNDSDEAEPALTLSISEQALAEACDVLLNKAGFSALLRATPENIRKMTRFLSLEGASAPIGTLVDENTQLYIDLPNVAFFAKGGGSRESACVLFGGETMRAQFNARDAIALSYAAEELALR